LELNSWKIGFALTGSFCTFQKVIPEIIKLKDLGADIVPIMSETVYSTDTRFGTAQSFINKLQEITGKEIIHSIFQAEPIGPKSLIDFLIIAPCTGNTLAKLAYGINDSCVTMSAKAHLRNKKPVIIAPSTNDGLSASGKNIGMLLNTKNIYFVPFKQDDPHNKNNSVVSDMSLIYDSLISASKGIQLQPILT